MSISYKKYIFRQKNGTSKFYWILIKKSFIPSKMSKKIDKCKNTLIIDNHKNNFSLRQIQSEDKFKNYYT